MHPGLLCTTVRDLLRLWFQDNTRCPLSPDSIHVTPDDRPFPYSGESFIAVHGSGWNSVNDDTNVALDYYLGVTCTLTRRTPHIPMQKVGTEAFAKQYEGMAATCLEIMRAIGNKTSLFQRLATNPEYQFYTTPSSGHIIGQLFEYLRFQDADPSPNPVYEDHFSAKNEHLNDENGMAIMGYTMAVRFGKARCGVFQ